MRRRMWLGVLLVLLVGACTTAPEPTPSPSPATPMAPSAGPTEPIGVRVAVVLPPEGSAPLTPAGTRLAADAAASRQGSALGEVRTVVPDPGAFVGDVATLLAEQGYDLVCVVGGEAAEVVVEVAPGFPATRFCATPVLVPLEPDAVPANVLLIDLRVEEVAYLAGVAAGAAPSAPSPSPPEEEDTPPPPAGMIGDASDPWTARQRVGFAAGLASVIGNQPAPRIDLAATTAEEVAARAVEQYDAGVPVVYAAGGGDAGVLEAAAEHGALAIVQRDRARFGGGTPDSVLVWLLLDLAVPLDLAVSRAVEGWEGGVVSVGVAEGAVRPQAGGTEGATSTFATVRDAAAGLRDGSRTIPAP